MIKTNSQIVGFIAGLIGPVIGSMVYYMLQFYGWKTFKEFIQFTLNTEALAPVISLSAIFNLLIFFFFLWRKWDRSARGVILATFVYVLVVILIKFS